MVLENPRISGLQFEIPIIDILTNFNPLKTFPYTSKSINSEDSNPMKIRNKNTPLLSNFMELEVRKVSRKPKIVLPKCARDEIAEKWSVLVADEERGQLSCVKEKLRNSDIQDVSPGTEREASGNHIMPV
ncbi:hypothetical protein K2173_009243 [Erythroxylum novogranatense]|uniref:Uncharacterized protein n=1 Tax=Erythroxylum novogranatense TaxID=1862640 RepID=A0AAV8S5N3_9ROSI|nr:hypothetical protein K2173_009243 [Erythroxylum novogranatense]